MCLGGEVDLLKQSNPKPSPLPPPVPAPPPPKPAPPPPKKLQEPDATPDIRIGAAKKQSGGQRNRNTQRDTSGPKSLSIGNNQGLNL